MNKQLLKGTFFVNHILFRQNKLRISFWLVALVGISVASALAYTTVYTSEQEMTAFAQMMKNPALIALLGPSFPMDGYHIGAIFSNELTIFTAIAVAVMNILLASRSTKEDEEEGRVEMIQALPVGRLAYLAAAVLQLLLVNGLLVILMGTGLSLLRVESMDIAGSFLYGSAMGSVGIFFSAVTILFGQLTETARGTSQLSFGFLLLFYIIRAVGDVQENFLVYLSPFGVMQRIYPFVSNKSWPVFILMTTSAVIFAIAVYFNKTRDLGSGILPSRAGRREASFFLQSTAGWYGRLEWITIFTGMASIFLLSAVFGSILQELEFYYADFEFVQKILPSGTSVSLTNQFLDLLLVILSNISVIPALLVLLRVQREEKLERLENILSRPVSRYQVLGDAYGWAILAACLMQSAIGGGIFLAVAESVRMNIDWFQIIKAVGWYGGAIWFVLSLGIFLIGRFPRSLHIIWIYVSWTFLVSYLGELFDFPVWLRNTSVFYSMSNIFFKNVSGAWVSGYIIVGILFTVSGFQGYRERDMKA